MTTLDAVAPPEPQPATAAPTSRPTVSWAAKVLYGVGDAANTIKQSLFALFTLFFYTTVMGLPGSLVGIAAAIGLVWDAVVDPYIGHLSDHLPRELPLGRRHTFMLVGGVAMGIGFALFFSPPQSLGTVALFLWLLLIGIVVRSGNSLYSIPYYALGAELSTDYHERTTITAMRGALALLGTMLAATLSVAIFFPQLVPGVDPKLDYAGYPPMGMSFGAVMTLLALVATLGTLSQRARLAERPRTAQRPSGLLSSFANALRFSSFRRLFLSFALFYLGIVVNSTLLIHYLTYYVEITSSTVLAQLQGAFYVAALVGAVLWLWLSRHVEKQHLYLLSMGVVTLLLIGAWALMGEGHLLGTGNVPAMLIGQMLAGFFGSILWIIPGSMLADVADEDALVHGTRREGTFFGIFNFGQQIATGASLLLTGVLLDYFARLQPGVAEQSATTTQRLGMLYGLLPALLILLAIWQISRYHLTRERVLAVQGALRESGHPLDP